MRTFPQESIDQAREIARKYKQRTRSKQALSARLYDKQFFHLDYGFSEAIRSGNCGKYLHEMTKEANCFTMTGVLYLIAKEIGLEPKIYRAIGFKDVKEGEDASEQGTYDHTFITASVGKEKEQMIDPFMSLFGKARFISDEQRIEVYNRGENKVTSRNYSGLRELSEEDYLELLEKNRSPEGGRTALAATQLVYGRNNTRVYISYNDKRKEIASSIRVKTAKFGPENHKGAYITDLATSVGEDGEFDFNDGKFSFYNALSTGWGEHDNPQEPIIYPVNKAQEAWKLFDEIFSATGRKTPAQGMWLKRLEKLIEDSGFNEDFSLSQGSLAEKVVTDKNLTGSLDLVNEENERSADDFIPRCRADDLSYRVLLRDAHYIKDHDAAKSEENPNGFVFSEEEHMALLKEAFRSFKISSIAMAVTLINTAEIDAKLKEGGNRYNTSRKFNSEMERHRIGMKCFETMSLFRSSKLPKTFNHGVDIQLSHNRFDLDNIEISELEEGLEEEHLRRVVQDRLFYRLLFTYHEQHNFFLASYQKGLKRILDRRE